MIETVSEFCRGLGLPEFAAADLIEVLRDEHLAELAAHEARMQRAAGRPDNEVLPLTEEGHEFGRVEARIPATLAFNLIQREGFGVEGLLSDEGMKDLLRDNPQCRVKTVRRRAVSGWTPGRKVVKKY